MSAAERNMSRDAEYAAAGEVWKAMVDDAGQLGTADYWALVDALARTGWRLVRLDDQEVVR